jgi:thiamine thiazole synthase
MPIFQPVEERDVTRAIIRKFSAQFDEYVQSDVIIVGGGPAGLIAAIDLCKKGIKTLIIERNNYLGGGFWIGGYFMNILTIRAPAQKVLDELGVPYEKFSKGLYTASAPHTCAAAIAAACSAGARILSLTSLEDLIIKGDKRVAGVVINWSPIAHLPKEISALDPVPLECKVVIDATGHDAGVVKKLEKRGLLQTQGEGPLWITASEDQVVEHTGEVYPGLVVCGMAVGTVYGVPRMGPTFGGMLLSGKRAAVVAERILRK